MFVFFKLHVCVSPYVNVYIGRVWISGVVKFGSKMISATKILPSPLFDACKDKWGEVPPPQNSTLSKKSHHKKVGSNGTSPLLFTKTKALSLYNTFTMCIKTQVWKNITISQYLNNTTNLLLMWHIISLMHPNEHLE